MPIFWKKTLPLEFVLLVLLCQSKGPGWLNHSRNEGRSPCGRDSSTLVRKIVQKRILPVLEKHRVSLPKECPLHLDRDIFKVYEVHKVHPKTSQWLCGFCGKAFYTEMTLDQHFDTRHTNEAQVSEDSVCLSDFCDVMRCEVLKLKTDQWEKDDVITDVELWRAQNQKPKPNALERVPPKDLARDNSEYRHNFLEKIRKLLGKENKNTTTSKSVDAVIAKGQETDSEQVTTPGSTPDVCNRYTSLGTLDPSCPYRVHTSPMAAKVKVPKDSSECSDEELMKLKEKCEILLAECVSTLILQLSKNEFLQLEDELHRAVCWYLRCDRYWEDGVHVLKPLPWGLLLLLIATLTLAICICYYIIWVAFELLKLVYRHYAVPTSDWSGMKKVFHDGGEFPSDEIRAIEYNPGTSEEYFDASTNISDVSYDSSRHQIMSYPHETRSRYAQSFYR